MKTEKKYIFGCQNGVSQELLARILVHSVSV